jgi:ribA/ribD-fused uncharacterized protein
MSGLEEQKFIFFWNPTKDNGFLSNWYESPFVKDGKLFISNEQYFMWEKQQLFDPINVGLEIDILSTSNPKIIKNLGRKVQNFNPSLWDEKKYEIMKNGLIEKFSQNHDLRELLFNTEDAILVEASQYDSIWGIGLNEDDAKKIPHILWPGQNLLGIALMDVRNILRIQSI